jgi:hypothetical protein
MKKLIITLMSLTLILAPVSSARAKTSTAGYLNQVLAIGTSVIGANILLDCKLGIKTPSIVLFFGGSLAYIASEMLGASAQKAFLKASTEEVDKLVTAHQGEATGDVQEGIIDVKLAEEKEKLNFAKKRKNWMTAIGIVYGAAAALAAAEAWAPWEWVSPACEGFATLPIKTALSYAIVGAFAYLAGQAGGNTFVALGTAIVGAVNAGSVAFVLPMNNPVTRVVTFGVAAALSTTITIMLGEEVKDLESNVEKLEKLAAKFKEEKGPGLEPGPVGNDYQPGNGPGRVNNLPTGASNVRSCWSQGSNGAPEFSAGGCRNVMRVSRPQFDSRLNLPALQGIANQGMDLAQAFADGDTARADTIAGDINANAGRLKAINKNLMAKLNEKLKKEGKKPIDLDAEVNKQVAALTAGANKALLEKNLPGIGETNLAAALDNLKKEESNGPSGLVKDEDSAASSDAKPVGTISEGNFEDIDPNAAKTASLEDVINEYEVSESDVNKDTGVSIFTQVSNRYLLSYPKIFQRREIKIPEAPKEESSAPKSAN